jgi:uncharacterized membrane protein YfcA
MNPDPLLLISLATGFFLIALVYSSVGFGGGSSYLALLSLLMPFPELIRTQALLCNLAVVSISCFLAWKEGVLDLKKALPYTLPSIPMAFLGARYKLSEKQYMVLLGFTLVASALALLIQASRKVEISPRTGFSWQALPLGGAIGFLSGLVGIGGGIFLSPVLNLLRWDTPRQIATLASFFIFVNSLAGLSGLWASQAFSTTLTMTLSLCGAVALGGFIGARVGIRKLDGVLIRRITALLVLLVGLKLLYDQLLK